MELINERVVRCRKETRCMNCLQPVKVGEQKEIQFCKDGSDVWTWISHVECNKAAAFHWSEPSWEGIPALIDQIDGGQPIDDYEHDFPEAFARLQLTLAQREEKRKCTAQSG